MKLIPAIDIIDGKCVRLTKGDYGTKKIYNKHPLEVAKQFEDHGIQYLHLVDLDGAKAKQIVNYNVLEQLASKTNLVIDFGGGIKTEKDLSIAFECGANQVTIGSLAAQQPELFIEWLKKFGSDQLILGADANNRKIATMGWQEETDEDVVTYIQNYEKEGVITTICTDIQKDGMLQGPSVLLYKEILDQTNVELIASGGIHSLADLDELEEMGCYGAIIGKAIYEGKITLNDIQFRIEH